MSKQTIDCLRCTIGTLALSDAKKTFLRATKDGLAKVEESLAQGIFAAEGAPGAADRVCQQAIRCFEGVRQSSSLNDKTKTLLIGTTENQIGNVAQPCQTSIGQFRA